MPARPALLACLLLASPAGGTTAPATADGQLCRAAVAVAEREASLPPRLMAAIARVESGRRDPHSGETHPWPWTINAEGRGSFFPDKAAALAAVRALQAQGVRSIDVGCLQVNLRHHPTAFASLEDALDPLSNARYAARFLTELQSSRSDWMAAASAYHSQTPEFAAPYRARVTTAWAIEQGLPATPPAASLPVTRPGPSGGFMLSNGADRAQVLANANPGSGRGLAAYRAAPIPLSGRALLPPRRL